MKCIVIILIMKRCVELMKTTAIFLLTVILSLMLTGCGNTDKTAIPDSSNPVSDEAIPNSSSPVSNEASPESETKDETQYEYNFGFDDIADKDEIKRFKKDTDSITDYTSDVEIRGILHHINSVKYSYSTEKLVENFYYVRPEVIIENKKITSGEILVLVNIDYTNKSNEKVENYLNAFYFVGVTSDDPYSWIDCYAGYHDKVLYPEENNRSYFLNFIEPNSTYNGTIGFFVDEMVLKNANNYLRMSPQGSSDHNYYIKLPPLEAE